MSAQPTLRLASPGMFCIWIDFLDGTDYRVPSEFPLLEMAKRALDEFVKSGEAQLCRHISIYDDQGQLRERRTNSNG